jgi:hypothetical protein
MPISALRNAVAGVLAVVDAQRRLRFESTGDLVEEMLGSALDIVRAEHAVHEAVAPNRTGTSEWKKKAQLLEKALGWLRESQANKGPRRQGSQTSDGSPGSIAM